MSPTLEEAIAKLKANEVEAGQQVLLRILSDDPKNDLAWKILIESYTDLELQLGLANEYFNLTGGSLKATQAVLRLSKMKNERYARLQEDELQGLGKLKGYIKWKKALLVKVIIGLLAFILLSNMLLLVSSIGSSVRSKRIQADFDRLSGIYSESLLEKSSLQARYSDLETQYAELLATYQQLVQDYKALTEGIKSP
jgi:hypothetical protein